MKDLEREHRELRRTHEILRKASAFFAAAERERVPGSRITVSFIDEHRYVGGVEPICAVLPTPKSTDSAWLRQRRDPSGRAARVQRDEVRPAAIRRSWVASRRLCGARKVWRELLRTPPDALGIDGPVARCTVECLMRQEGLAGVVRGRPVRTTVPADVADRPQNRVKRDFSAPAPNRLWVRVGGLLRLTRLLARHRGLAGHPYTADRPGPRRAGPGALGPPRTRRTRPSQRPRRASLSIR